MRLWIFIVLIFTVTVILGGCGVDERFVGVWVTKPSEDGINSILWIESNGRFASEMLENGKPTMDFLLTDEGVNTYLCAREYYRWTSEGDVIILDMDFSDKTSWNDSYQSNSEPSLASFDFGLRQLVSIIFGQAGSPIESVKMKEEEQKVHYKRFKYRSRGGEEALVFLDSDSPKAVYVKIQETNQPFVDELARRYRQNCTY